MDEQKEREVIIVTGMSPPTASNKGPTNNGGVYNVHCRYVYIYHDTHI